jgi:hypothetical protein
MWEKSISAHRAAIGTVGPGAADVYSERLASSLLLQSLLLFFLSGLTWEWGAAGELGDALLAPRLSARRLIALEASSDEVSRSRSAELSMLARTLRWRPTEYVLVSVAPLLAYRGANQVGEFDGCFFEWGPDAIRLTVVEAKKMRSGAKSSAVRSLDETIRRLGFSEHVSVGQVAAERWRAGLARAWVELEIRRPEADVRPG